MLTEITYRRSQAIARCVPRAKVQPGSVTFIQRCGSALHVTLHVHCICLERVSLARTDQSLTPRCVTAEPPSNANIAAMIQQISQRVIRTLRRGQRLRACRVARPLL